MSLKVIPPILMTLPKQLDTIVTKCIGHYWIDNVLRWQVGNECERGGEAASLRILQLLGDR